MTVPEIDNYVSAIWSQCGMRPSVTKSWDAYGPFISVQVRLVEDADPEQSGHWRFFSAHDETELPRLRDELVDFIAANRKEVAA